MNQTKFSMGKWTLALIAISLLGINEAALALQLDNLRVEYCENPLGIDAHTPRLSWQLASSERGQKQTAYRVLVASSLDLLKGGQGDLWDSGKVASDQSIQVHYAGKPLVARQNCFWKVQIWDKDGQASAWSSVALWEMGLFRVGDWNDAHWIRLEKDTRQSPLTKRPMQTKPMKDPRLAEAFPSPFFRREFAIKPSVVRARAYVCGLGYNEVFVNGQRLGDGAVLDPGQTTYDVRAFYVTRDITNLLRRGTNAVGVMLGNGFFGQNHAFNVAWLGYGSPMLLAKLVVDYADGTTQVIATDESWKANTGPILYDNVYGGETYDARCERAGWNLPGFDDSHWPAARQINSPTKILQAQMIPPIRCEKIIEPTRIFPGTDGKWIFDLGQNFAGWARIKVKAAAGTELTLKFAEILMPDGQSLDYATTGVSATGVEQTDIYVCKGDGVETWSPRFTYHGFRYVEVVGLKSPPAKDFLVGVPVHTDAPRAGSFVCSDEILNRIYQTSLTTIENCMHSVMEDCPHREKCGWLGDAHAVGETTIYNYDVAQFWTKFVDDIETVLGRGGETYWGQKATPGIPCNIAVGRRLCQEARPDWGAAYVLLPAYLYNYYGDTDVFARHYDHLKDWIQSVRGLREDGIVVRGYGDWCPPGGNNNMECPPPLTSTAFFYGTLRLMETFADRLGKNSDAQEFAALAEETKTAFNRKFYDESTGGYGSQTADAVALRFGIFPDGKQGRVAKALADEVTIRHQGHAFVGIHGAKPLYTQLCANGYEDIAITALKQPTWPSYARALADGFTTWPEQLDEMKPGKRIADFSLNHPMQSGFAAWFHESLGGIRPVAPGFKQIDLTPHGYTQLAWAKTDYASPYGRIVSDWRSERRVFFWSVTIPPNTTATVSVPARSVADVTENGQPAATSTGVKFLRLENGRAIYAVESGRYEFKSRW